MEDHLGFEFARGARKTSWIVAAIAVASGCGGDSSSGRSVPDASSDASGDSAAPGNETGGPADGSGDASRLADASGDATQIDSSGSDATSSDARAGDGASPADGGSASDSGGDAASNPHCSGAVLSTNAPQTSLPSTPALTVPPGFTIQAIAAVSQARELAALPNGDLLVATSGSAVYLVPNAEASAAPGAPVKFATMPESPAHGITFAPSSCTIYVATGTGIYAIPYSDAQQTATPGPAIAHVRTGGTGGHATTSVAFAGGMLYASVGSSCDSCVETDPTRASVQVMAPSGANMTVRAKRIRNAIALTTNPATGTIWAGVAGQDSLPTGHPFEFFDGVTLHAGVADYGWPDCEENNHTYTSGANCASTVAPLVELPAYSTIIGATFYPVSPSGAHAFSATYRGGAFLAAHGSWHQNGSQYIAPPRVVYVPMNGDAPATAVDWTDPTKQWSDFVSGFQSANGTTRIGRPTGVAVGATGSLFVADDQNGTVYRIRPM
jgi:glucose/arabinose dehydrogenase